MGFWVLKESHATLKTRWKTNGKKNSIMTSTEIVVEKVLTQLTANYDPHESFEFAPHPNQNNKCEALTFLGNILPPLT